MSTISVLNDIKTACRKVSQQCLSTQSGGRSISIRDSGHTGEVVTERMTYIFLTEWAVRIGLRICYDYDKIAKIVGGRHDLSDPADLRNLTAFTKELANLTAGAIGEALDGGRKIIGLSLPVANRMVEPIKTKSAQRGMHIDVWDLCGADGSSITVLLYIEVPNEALLDTVTVLDISKSAEDSDLEFL